MVITAIECNCFEGEGKGKGNQCTCYSSRKGSRGNMPLSFPGFAKQFHKYLIFLLINQFIS